MTLPPTPEFLALQRAVAGRYSLDREIGRGGMGIVYLARDVALERPVAIKLLPPVLAGIDGFRERFLREARTAAGLSHPHIVPIHAVEERDGLVYFVMEYVAGSSAGERVRREGSLPVDDATRILREIAWALAHAHGRGIIHRDIKPDNILLEAGTGRVIVTDLGIAHAEGAAVSGAAGTPHYVSPELLAGAAPSVQSDLYALGVTAWVLLTGRRPFEGAEGPALLAEQSRHAAPPIASVAPRLAPRLAEAIDRTLAREPTERWPSAEAFAGELGAALALRGTVPAPLLRFVREGRALGEQVAFGLVGAATAEIALVTLFGWDDFAAVVFHTLAALLGAFAVVRFGEIVAAARELRAQGWRQAAAIAADRVDAAGDSPALPFRAAPLRSSGFVLVSGIIKTAIAGGVLVYVEDSLLIGLLSAAALVILPALTAVQLWRISGTKKRSLWSRLLEGRLGRWLFDWAGVGLTEDKAAPVPGEPTALVLGQSIEAMYAALPPAQQKVLAELPDLAARLQARALGKGPERTPAVVALETLRLDLLRVQAGTITEPELTADLAAVRRIGEDVDRVVAANLEVRAL
jgi:hypothetical protein